MRKVIVFYTCFFLLTWACYHDYEGKNYSSNEWNDELWQELLNDSSFIAIKELIKVQEKLEIMSWLRDSLSREERVRYMKDYNEQRIKNFSQRIQEVKNKYPNYSFQYYDSLNRLVNTIPPSISSRINVTGDCSLSEDNYTEICSIYLRIKNRYLATYHSVSYSQFKSLFFSGQVIASSDPSIFNGLRPLVSYLEYHYYDPEEITCASISQLAVRVRQAGSQLLDILNFLIQHEFDILANPDYDLTYPNGGTSENTPKRESTNPIKNLKNKYDNAEFIKKMEELASKVNLDYEVGYKYVYMDSEYKFVRVDGNKKLAEIVCILSKTNPIDGFVHTHYNGTLPIFSVGDLLTPYYWNKREGISDLSSFCLGLVTTENVYFLFFDKTAYTRWGKENINSIELIEHIYKDVYNITETTDPAVAETKFVDFLESSTEGIHLYKRIKGTGEKEGQTWFEKLH